jgi:hypothetical protein
MWSGRRAIQLRRYCINAYWDESSTETKVRNRNKGWTDEQVAKFMHDLSALRSSLMELDQLFIAS